MSTGDLVEFSLPGLDDETVPAVTQLFGRWGRGGAVVEQIADDSAGSTVKAYLLAEEDEALRQVEIGLALLRRAYGSADTGRLPELRIRLLTETDWAEAWKAGYDVLRIGRRLVIRPGWRDYTPQPGDLVIELDPGMAFGSGLHPTTRLCLEALENHLRPGQAVLDVGTGSGILAIAAARLGASHVLALDTDPLAVQIARENVARNYVESVVHVEVGTLEISNPKSPWPAGQDGQISNLAVANILAETIIELAPALAAQLSPAGILIASGIITDRADAVVASLRESGLLPVERRDDGDWVALVSRNSGLRNQE